jgi:hypothetical protein
MAFAAGFLVGVVVACIALTLWRLTEREDDRWRY